MKRLHFLLILVVLTIAVMGTKRFWLPLMKGNKTVADRLKEFGSTAQGRLVPNFQKAGIQFPPARLVFIGVKNQARLEIYAANADGVFRFIREYPILRASGTLGPKLKEGDLQVPEGLYGIELLNPNSRYHVSMRINYPNEFDREQAAKEGRQNLGGDIMIHGKAVSVGCLAIGDEAAEDCFVLGALTGIKNIEVILTPVDFRREPMPAVPGFPGWTDTVYEKIKRRLAELPLPS